MVKRRIRPEEELDRIFRQWPHIERLYKELDDFKQVKIQADGTGSSVFKVYLPGRMGSYEVFLRVNKPLDESYVQSAHQGDHERLCRDIWGPLVRNRKNPDGSQLRPQIDVDTVLEATKQYTEEAASAI